MTDLIMQFFPLVNLARIFTFVLVGVTVVLVGVRVMKTPRSIS